ncbi:hypothetical protein [Paenibacillus sp. FSL H7-0357]|jgi:hypothetical protein|uniref:hypothetical protein n=2 Tax=Paenibacillus sp. FSL H7-0357 TaxID=1536774 RepID=UPI00056E04B3|nr:hypothetical protein [Paenibacillus sp. FSL H7-0357]
MDPVEVYKGRRPAELMMTISLCVSIGIAIFSMLYLSEEGSFSLYFAYVWSIFCLTIIGVLLQRLFTARQIMNIELIPGAIILKDLTIEAEKTKAVYIKGYFKPVVGIKPNGNVFVPYKSCFSFAEKEDQGMKALKAWAEQHQIEVFHKSFKRWL